RRPWCWATCYACTCEPTCWRPTAWWTPSASGPWRASAATSTPRSARCSACGARASAPARPSPRGLPRTAGPRGRLEQPARAVAEPRPLVLEQPALTLHAGGVAREPAVGSDDAVARHHHSQPVGAVGLGHGPHRPGVAQALREPQVGERPARRDAPQLVPHAELEGAARQ